MHSNNGKGKAKRKVTKCAKLLYMLRGARCNPSRQDKLSRSLEKNEKIAEMSKQKYAKVFPKTQSRQRWRRDRRGRQGAAIKMQTQVANPENGVSSSSSSGSVVLENYFKPVKHDTVWHERVSRVAQPPCQLPLVALALKWQA